MKHLLGTVCRNRLIEGSGSDNIIDSEGCQFENIEEPIRNYVSKDGFNKIQIEKRCKIIRELNSHNDNVKERPVGGCDDVMYQTDNGNSKTGRTILNLDRCDRYGQSKCLIEDIELPIRNYVSKDGFNKIQKEKRCKIITELNRHNDTVKENPDLGCGKVLYQSNNDIAAEDLKTILNLDRCNPGGTFNDLKK